MTTKIVDARRSKPFGIPEITKLLRDVATGKVTLRPGSPTYTEEILAAADEIERRAAAAGKEAVEREIKPGEWFIGEYGHLRYRGQDWHDRSVAVDFTDGYVGHNSLTNGYRGIPVQVQIIVTDQEA